MLARILPATLVALLSCGLLSAAESGLVAHWSCNEGDGTTLHDRSGLDNHGTLHGAEWVISGKGYALRFDGVSDYVDCGNNGSLDLRKTLTLSAWIRPRAANPQQPGIVGKWTDSYALLLDRGNCRFTISGSDNSVAAPLSAGQWHHVAGTFDGRRLRLYIDGVEKAHADSKTPGINPGRNFSMGRLLPDPAATSAGRGAFEGLLDEVKLYNRALSAQDVLAEYNRQADEKDRAKLESVGGSPRE